MMNDEEKQCFDIIRRLFLSLTNHLALVFKYNLLGCPSSEAKLGSKSIFASGDGRGKRRAFQFEWQSPACSG